MLMLAQTYSYANDDALAVTHRSKGQYKHMRATVAEHPIITWPVQGLTQMAPSGVGFLSKSSTLATLTKETFVRLSEYTTTSAKSSDDLLEDLKDLAKSFERDDSVLSFWALKPREPSITNSIIVFSRFKSQENYTEGIAQTIADLEYVSTYTICIISYMHQLTWWFYRLKFRSSHSEETVKIGLWDGAGFGFIRGNHFRPA